MVQPDLSSVISVPRRCQTMVHFFSSVLIGILSLVAAGWLKKERDTDTPHQCVIYLHKRGRQLFCLTWISLPICLSQRASRIGLNATNIGLKVFPLFQPVIYNRGLQNVFRTILISYKFWINFIRILNCFNFLHIDELYSFFKTKISCI